MGFEEPVKCSKQKCEYYADLWHPQSTWLSLRNRTCAYSVPQVLSKILRVFFCRSFKYSAVVTLRVLSIRTPSHIKQGLHKTQTIWRLNYVETITICTII